MTEIKGTRARDRLRPPRDPAEDSVFQIKTHTHTQHFPQTFHQLSCANLPVTQEQHM